MRPAITRVTFRAASSLVSRNSSRPAPVPRIAGGRPCSSSAVSNDPVAKHSASQVSASNDALKSSGTHSSPKPTPDQSVETSAAPAIENEPLSAAPAADASTSADAASSTQVTADTSSSMSTSQDSASVASVLKVDSSAVSSESIPTDTDAATSSTGRNFIEPSSDSAELVTQIRGYLRRNAVRSALYHFISALKVDGSPAVDENVLQVALPVLGRHGWAPSALDAINLALKREYNLEVGLYNCGLHAMARSGDYDTLQDVIKRMWSLPAESRPNATSYNYLIGSFMYRGAVDRAFDVLQEMKNHMIYPTFATYHALISGCLRSNDPRRAYTTLNAVERQRFDIGAMTISQVLVSCADADLTDEVSHLLPRLAEALPRYASEVHRIAEKRQAYRMNNTEENSRNNTTTTAADRAMIRGDPKPEIGIVSSILHCAFRNCKPELAIEGWALIKRYYSDLRVPDTMWYCLIGAFAGAGDFSKAFDILGVMREQGYTPRLKDLEIALVRPLSLEIGKVDEQYYKLCDRVKSGSADAPDTADDFAAASAKHEEQGEEDTSADVTAADEAVSGESLRDVLSQRTSSDGSEVYWKEMEPSSVGIDELNSIIAACSFAGDLDRAFQTYDEIESVFGVTKNTETYNALLEGCIQVKHVRGGMRIIAEMEKQGIQLGGEALHLAVRLLTRAARAPECTDLLIKVRNDGGNVTLQTYMLLIRYFIRGDAVSNALEVYNMAISDGHEPRSLRGRLDGEGARKLREALEYESGEQDGLDETAGSDDDGGNVALDDDPLATELDVSSDVEDSAVNKAASQNTQAQSKDSI